MMSEVLLLCLIWPALALLAVWWDSWTRKQTEKGWEV